MIKEFKDEKESDGEDHQKITASVAGVDDDQEEFEIKGPLNRLFPLML